VAAPSITIGADRSAHRGDAVDPRTRLPGGPAARYVLTSSSSHLMRPDDVLGLSEAADVAPFNAGMALDPDDRGADGAGPVRHSRRGVYLRGLPAWCLTVGQVSETRPSVQPAIPTSPTSVSSVAYTILCQRCNQPLLPAVSLRIPPWTASQRLTDSCFRGTADAWARRSAPRSWCVC
jgi:hypothetical protein